MGGFESERQGRGENRTASLLRISPGQAERGEATERVPNRHPTVYSWTVDPNGPQHWHLFCLFSLSPPSRRARSTSWIVRYPCPQIKPRKIIKYKGIREEEHQKLWDKEIEKIGFVRREVGSIVKHVDVTSRIFFDEEFWFKDHMVISTNEKLNCVKWFYICEKNCSLEDLNEIVIKELFFIEPM